jgi:hypothetical protein
MPVEMVVATLFIQGVHASMRLFELARLYQRPPRFLDSISALSTNEFYRFSPA